MTYEEWTNVIQLPYHEANAGMAAEPRVEEYKARFFNRENPATGWFMHPTDHYAALKTILGGEEPSWVDVWTSLFAGSGNIDLAWRMTLLAPDGAPNDWAPEDGTDTRRFFRLVTP